MGAIRFKSASVLLAAGLLAACAPQGGTASGGGAASDTPVREAEYLTRSGHFEALQDAALKADYARFAGLLQAPDPQAVVASLQQSFSGRPFDAYTAQSRNTNSAHKRLLELRGTGGRLYLYVELDKVPGGWDLARYDMGRSRTSVLSNL